MQAVGANDSNEVSTRRRWRHKKCRVNRECKVYLMEWVDVEHSEEVHEKVHRY